MYCQRLMGVFDTGLPGPLFVRLFLLVGKERGRIYFLGGVHLVAPLQFLPPRLILWAFGMERAERPEQGSRV